MSLLKAYMYQSIGGYRGIGAPYNRNLFFSYIRKEACGEIESEGFLMVFHGRRNTIEKAYLDPKSTVELKGVRI